MHKKIWTDLALRSGGLVLLCLAAMIAQVLFGGAHTAGPLDYLLAAIGFLSASAGGALSWQGSHLFDEIVLSARWTAHRAVESAGQ